MGSGRRVAILALKTVGEGTTEGARGEFAHFSVVGEVDGIVLNESTKGEIVLVCIVVFSDGLVVKLGRWMFD